MMTRITLMMTVDDFNNDYDDYMVYIYPLYQCPGGKKFPAGILGKSQREPGAAQYSAGTSAGSGKNSAGIPAGVIGNWE